MSAVVCSSVVGVTVVHTLLGLSAGLAESQYIRLSLHMNLAREKVIADEFTKQYLQENLDRVGSLGTEFYKN